MKKRVAANDPVALIAVGRGAYQKKDFDGAFAYWTKAAELGDAEAHFELSVLYRNGEGVEKDEKKEYYHLEEAAIRGHPSARHNLGYYERMSGRTERSAKHYIIAVNVGFDESIQTLKEYYKHGLVSKEDFAGALRAHQAAVAAVDATKSPQREAAEKFYAALLRIDDTVLPS